MAQKIALDSHAWKVAHELCARVDSGVACNDDVAALAERFLAGVTCGCQAHVRTYLSEAPPREIAAGRAFEWSWRFHDQVNERLQKSVRPTLAEARRLYATSFVPAPAPAPAVVPDATEPWATRAAEVAAPTPRVSVQKNSSPAVVQKIECRQQ